MPQAVSLRQRDSCLNGERKRVREREQRVHILTVNGKLNQYSPKPMHLISDVHSTDGCQHPQLRDRITLLHVSYLRSFYNGVYWASGRHIHCSVW